MVGKSLSDWLNSLLSHSEHVTLCTLAYEAHLKRFSQLQFQAAEEEKMSGPANKLNSFACVRHYLGRLAQHIRAPKELFETAPDMGPILDNFDVSSVKHIASVLPPAPDEHTNLHGILNRMLGKEHDERREIENGLFKFNAVKHVFENFLGEYQNLRPRVHAEVQILEHFYRNRLCFAKNDRYVACSKLACLCCAMYFRYHPARMVIPDSHQNVWTNWGPPLVEKFSKSHEAGKRQLDILNNMIHDLRNMVISQALGQSSVGNRYPDSCSGITELHSFRSSPTPVKTQQGNSSSIWNDISMDRPDGGLEFHSSGRSISSAMIGDLDGESDIEGGGVSIHI